VKPLPVADRWFETHRIDDAITKITEPHVHAIWRSNIWHVRGRDADMLVDAGMGIDALAPALASFIDKPLIAVATHRHSDHIGGLHEFDVRVGHQADAPFIAHPGPATLSTAAFPDGFKKLVADQGTPFGEYLIDAVPYAAYDVTRYAIKGAPLTRIVGVGDTIDLGDRAFEVLHLPGHTPGCIGLWDANRGVLFSGDAIYDGLIFDFLPESNIPDYCETMRRLRELPVTAVHGGHDPSFGRARLIELVDAYLARRGTSPA
jgi:glyoxylase-like metal-dependent hydrolase (beta-lactamase superfamily II)